MNFEAELDKLFATAIDVKDTIWYSETETLRDAILRVYEETNRRTDEEVKTTVLCYKESCKYWVDGNDNEFPICTKEIISITDTLICEDYETI